MIHSNNCKDAIVIYHSVNWNYQFLWTFLFIVVFEYLQFLGACGWKRFWNVATQCKCDKGLWGRETRFKLWYLLLLRIHLSNICYILIDIRSPFCVVSAAISKLKMIQNSGLIFRFWSQRFFLVQIFIKLQLRNWSNVTRL